MTSTFPIKSETAGGIDKRGTMATPWGPFCCVVTPLYFIGNSDLFNKDDLALISFNMHRTSMNHISIDAIIVT